VKDGTWCATYNDWVEMYWNQRKYKKTIQIDPAKSNVAVMWTVGGNNAYNKISQVVEKVAMDTEIHNQIDKLYEKEYDKSTNI
jgi:hypothetical protein